jgi:hypothetical protein
MLPIRKICIYRSKFFFHLKPFAVRHFGSKAKKRFEKVWLILCTALIFATRFEKQAVVLRKVDKNIPLKKLLLN